MSVSDDQPPRRLEARFTLLLRPDTTDPDEARADAEAFIRVSKESWYSPIRLDSKIEIIERYDDE